MKLIAINPCIMEDDLNATLTVGKEYETLDEDYERMGEICIIDDEDTLHYFAKEEMWDFFILSNYEDERHYDADDEEINELDPNNYMDGHI